MVVLEAPIHSPGTGWDDPATTRVLKAPVRSLGTENAAIAVSRTLKAPPLARNWRSRYYWNCGVESLRPLARNRMGRSCNDKGAESPRPLDPPGLAARFTRSLRSLVAVLAAPGRNRADGPFQSTQTGPRASPANCGAHVATLSRVASLPVRAFVGLPAVGRPLLALLVPRTLCRGTEAATARAPPIPRGRERVPAPRAGRATRGRAGLLFGRE